MAPNRLLKSIRLRNFLSYGPNTPEVELLPLNVIIGPNSSGKSNLLEAIDILRAMPSDVTQPIREGGGVGDYLWKGVQAKGNPTAEIDAVVHYPEGRTPLKYRFVFSMTGQRFEIVEEAVESHYSDPGEADFYFYNRHHTHRPVINVRVPAEAPAGSAEERVYRSLRQDSVASSRSILSQRKDPDQ